MLSRCRLLRVGSSGGGDYRSVPKVADEFQHVLLRNRWAFDHVAIDIGYLCAVAGRFTRDLIGSDRDAAAVKIVQRQLQQHILRRFGGSKSLALMMDGTEPLWKVQHMRLHPGKKFPEKFYRSAASPMVYLLEDKLRSLGPELRPPPTEFLVSGPGVPGPAEGKVSAWMLDLATRIPHPSTNPPGAAAVTPNDSLCLVGNTDLFLSVLAATPFHNVTAVTLNSGEFKSLSLKDCLQWLGLGDLLEPLSSTSPVSGAGATAANVQRQQQQRLAAVRTDVVLLYLMANGTSSTNLAPFSGVSFADLMDGYLAEQRAFTPAATRAGEAEGDSGQRCFSSFLFDEYPLVVPSAAASSASSASASLRLKPDALASVLTRAAKRSITFPSRPCAHSRNYLEVLLQSHAMLASGGIQNYGWVPPDSEESVPEKPPKVPLDQFIAHLRAAAASPSASPSSTAPAYIVPTRSRSFALTGLESLLLTSPEAGIIDQVVPMYARGHTMAPGVSQDIVATRSVFAALEKTRSALSGLVASATSAAAVAPAHPAILHYPTHYLVRTAGARGPPAGWAYHSVNLGLKSEAMNIRYTLNASDTALLRDLAASSAESGVSKRNVLHVFDAETQAWRETACDAVPAARHGDDRTDAATSLSTLRVLTWNVQFDRHSGERTPLGRDGIEWCSRTRYLALSRVLAEADADVVAMQETEPAWCAFLAEQSWVRDGYAMSCHAASHAISPWGVLMLIRRSLPVTAFTHANVAAFSGHTSAMPEVTLRLAPSPAPTAAAVTIGSMHLLAPYSENNVSNRETQLANLTKHLSAAQGGSGAGRIVMGDFNDYPAKFFRFPAEMGFKDAWQELHPGCDEVPPPVMPTGRADAAAVSTSGTRKLSESGEKEEGKEEEEEEERGYTINGVANPYAGRIIEPEFFGRADRVMYAARHLQPVHAELVGTRPVCAVLQESGVTHLVERPQERIPEYLFPSDHFGVLVEFQVM